MTAEKKKPTPSEIFRAIARLSSEADSSEAELRESLQEDGINPDDLLGRVMPRVKKLTDQLKSPSSIAVEPYLTDSQVKRLLGGPFHVAREEAISKIHELLDQFSDDELRSILQELQQRARTHSRR